VLGCVRMRVYFRSCVTSRARMDVRAHMHVFARVYNEEFKLIKFWLRTSALRVPPVKTRLTAYRRYHNNSGELHIEPKLVHNICFCVVFLF
jgi:hypothetical protein